MLCECCRDLLGGVAAMYDLFGSLGEPFLGERTIDVTFSCKTILLDLVLG